MVHRSRFRVGSGAGTAKNRRFFRRNPSRQLRRLRFPNFIVGFVVNFVGSLNRLEKRGRK